MSTKRTARSSHWAEDARTGKVGEDRVKAWFEAQGCEVKPVRGHPRWREFDIDFFVDGWGAVEVKGDTHPPKNIYVDILARDGDQEGLGWLFKSRATWIAYAFLNDDLVYMIRLSALQAHIEAHATRYWDRAEWTRSTHRRSMGTTRWQTCGFPVPLADLEAAQVMTLPPIDLP